MHNPDYYPIKLADKGPWHGNFSAKATLTGTLYGLSAAQVTQAAVDAEVVRLLINHNEQVDAFSKALTAFMRRMLRGKPTDPAGQPPTPPAALILPPGGLAAIEARTRQYAGIIKASSAYNKGVGEGYGIVAPERGELATPRIRSARALTNSMIELKVRKPGYRAAVVDCRRGDGDWEQVAFMTTAVWIDTRPPLVPGQPEVREYRCQGYAGNRRVGDFSQVVSIVTVP